MAVPGIWIAAVGVLVALVVGVMQYIGRTRKARISFVKKSLRLQPHRNERGFTIFAKARVTPAATTFMVADDRCVVRVGRVPWLRQSYELDRFTMSDGIQLSGTQLIEFMWNMHISKLTIPPGQDIHVDVWVETDDGARKHAAFEAQTPLEGRAEPKTTIAV